MTPNPMRVPTDAEVQAYDMDSLRAAIEQHQKNILVFQEKINDEQGKIQYISQILQRKMERLK